MVFQRRGDHIPPYANRYNCTCTYSLELAWLGYGQGGYSAHRTSILSATVENKGMLEWLEGVYGDYRETLDCVVQMYGGQEAINEILRILLDRVDELSIRKVIRLTEHTYLRWPSSSR